MKEIFYCVAREIYEKFNKERGVKMTEEEIQEALEKIYNCEIDVKWRDFRIYDIYFKIRYKENLQMGSVAIMYDTLQTCEGNISDIERRIDNEIVKIFKKERK